ncbi:pentapeptide repeat-containing protein [Salinimicrobium sp. CAU 1759]
MKIKSTSFTGCKLVQADFSDADLSSAVFRGCDLSGAIFFNTRMERTDFSTSENFSIDPENNIITGAKFSTAQLHGLLEKYKIDIL